MYLVCDISEEKQRQDVSQVSKRYVPHSGNPLQNFHLLGLSINGSSIKPLPTIAAAVLESKLAVYMSVASIDENAYGLGGNFALSLYESRIFIMSREIIVEKILCVQELDQLEGGWK